MVTGAPGVAVIGGDPPWSCWAGPPPGGWNRGLEEGTRGPWGCFPGSSVSAARMDHGRRESRVGRSAHRRESAMSLMPGTLSRAETVLAALDDEQRAAAQAVTGPVCILAGAGTGKTRTITH